MRCPGQDTRFWKPGAIFEVPCPKCGRMVEFFKDESTRRCKQCGHKIINPKMDFGCAAYCKYAAQCLGDGKILDDEGWDWSKVNVNGGAIAIGHPIGCSGTRVLVTLLHALKQRYLKTGIASLCLGGGEAVAMSVEMVG